jgi:hypothetical protein
MKQGWKSATAVALIVGCVTVSQAVVAQRPSTATVDTFTERT